MMSDLMHNLHLSPREILDFAVQVEEKSFALYSTLSKTVVLPQMKEIFASFAEEELKHKAAFQTMITEGNKETYDQKTLPEHMSFLRSIVNSTIFSKDLLHEKLKRVRDAGSTFEFLISVELDQILLYNDLRDFVIDKHKALIDTIISEERRHFVRIMQIKQMKDY